MIDYDALTLNYLSVWIEAEFNARAAAVARLFLKTSRTPTRWPTFRGWTNSLR